MSAPSRARPAAVLALLVAAACARGPGTPVGTARPSLGTPGPALRVHFLDVGQGDAALLEFPCAAVLIDTGGEGPSTWEERGPGPAVAYDAPRDSVGALRRHLDAFFARRPDLARTLHLLVLSHPHIDHTRGAPMVFSRYRVLNVIDNGHERGSGGQPVRLLHDRLLRSRAGHRDVRVADIPPATGLTDEVIDPVRCAEVDPQIRALWGGLERDPGWVGDAPFGRWPFENENNHSVVLRVDFGRASFLFPGDLEEHAIGALLERTRGTGLLDVDVYKVSHHGARNGTTAALVAAMTPLIAVISMSPAAHRAAWSGWRFGLPRRAALDHLVRGLGGRRRPRQVLVGERMGQFAPVRMDAAVYGTGWDGTVVVEAGLDGTLRVATTSDPPGATELPGAPAGATAASAP